MIQSYGFFGIVRLVLYKIRTKFLFTNARLIRFPFRIRGRKYIQIGTGFTTGFNCRLDAFDFNNSNRILIKVGENVQINDDVHIAAVESVEIGDDVLIASKVFITDHNHGNYNGNEIQDSPLSSPNSRRIYTDAVKIEKNVWLGEFVCVLQGVTIGEGSIIGAMSVVTKSIPPYSIAIGSPAKVIKTFDFEKNEWVRC